MKLLVGRLGVEDRSQEPRSNSIQEFPLAKWPHGRAIKIGLRGITLSVASDSAQSQDLP